MTSLAAELKYLTVIVLTLFFLQGTGYSQSVKDRLQRGDRYFDRKDYSNALKMYLEVLAADEKNAHANFKAGVSYLHGNDVKNAVHHLETAWQLAPDIDPRIDYHLAMAYQEDHQFAKAQERFEAFRINYKNLAGIIDQKIRECIFGDSLMQLASNAVVRRVPEINTPFNDFAPLLSGDGQTLIFTSNRSSNEYEIKSATNFEDVYIAHREGSAWSIPEKIHPSVNVKLNEAAVSLSPDGMTLYLYYEEGGGDLYVSKLEDGEWSRPEPLNRFINHPHYREMAACISPDGKRLFFSSNRPGGKGGYDLYVCERGANGDWGRPANLGSPVNTRGDEESPFLHADGVTLYFSSNGHPSLGNHDIYKSVLHNNSWSQPEHLGYPVNTSDHEGGFILSADEKTAYFSSRRGVNSDLNIYEASFQPTAATIPEAPAQVIKKLSTAGPPENKPVTVLKGTVVDAIHNTPLEATVRLVDNSNKMVVSTIKTAPSGTFTLTIPEGGNYGVMTERPGYLFNSLNITLAPFREHQEIDTHILMVKASVGSKVVLKNIFFDINEANLKPESMAELENVYDLLIKNPNLRIQINGHTDNVGRPEANMALSLKRAQSVVQYLVKAGIPADRLQAKGYGSERPLVSNDDEAEGRQINRRTEIEVIE